MLKREDFVDRLAQKGYTKKAARVIIDDMLAAITEVLAEGEEVNFHGFGRFYVNNTPQRESRSVTTGEAIQVPAHKTPKFSAGRSLKNAVWEGFVRE